MAAPIVTSSYFGYAQPKKKKPAVDPSLAATSEALNKKYGLGAYAPPVTTTGGTQPGDIDVEVPGEYFDPAEAIKGDWEYQGAQAAVTKANQAARAALATQRKQALVDLGIIPAGLDPDALSDIDEAARLEAAKNPYSAFAQAGLQKTRALDQLQAALGARGTLRSGAMQGGSQKTQTAYEATTNQATRSTLQALQEALGGYTGGVAQRELELQGIGSNVAQRLAADPRFQPRVVKARWDPGRGAYVSPTGGVYNANGQKIG
jgi:hypothetical protein